MPTPGWLRRQDLPVDAAGRSYIDPANLDQILDQFVNWRGDVNGGNRNLTNLATLSVSAINATGITTQDLTLSKAGPQLLWYETDAVADSKRWRLYADGGILRGDCANDALTTAGEWLHVTRSGVSPQVIRLLASYTVIGSLAAPARPFSVAGPARAYTASASGNATASIGTGVALTDEILMMGVDNNPSNPHGWIQASCPGTANRGLYLNCMGGGIAFGSGGPNILPNSCWQITTNEANNTIVLWVRYSTGVLKTVTLSLV